MLNFEFTCPTRIIFGNGTESNVFDELANKATDRGMLRNFKKLGKQDVLRILEIAKV